MSKKERIKKYTQALAELTEQPKVMLMVKPITLFGVCAHLQLGLRFSDADEMVKQDLKNFGKQIQYTLTNISPLVGDMLEVGWEEIISEEVQELMDECHLENTLNYLIEFHEYLKQPDNGIWGVFQRLVHLQETADILMSFKDRKDDEQLQKCLSTLKIVVTLCVENHNINLVGMDEVFKQLS